MALIKAEFSEEFYESLTVDQRNEITIRSVETGDYASNEEWQVLKKESNKTFKALKKKEFEIRKHLNLKL